MGKLILVPTPLQEDHPLETLAKELLAKEALSPEVLLLVEEHKVARQRWIRWGLPREAIEKFILFNEHTQDKIQPQIIKELKTTKRAYLLSDCGLPAFCDPGQSLVDSCHRQGVTVTSTPIANSVILALALSGFSHNSFIFSGFIPIKEPQRMNWIQKELSRQETLIWMETPYRLKKILEELKGLNITREIFLACDLGSEEESLFRGSPGEILNQLGERIKREFVLVICKLFVR
jgi:16S rRNA (cytidine1402-2'-O)-methyltransferase